jgi:hypothetical protein
VIAGEGGRADRSGGGAGASRGLLRRAPAMRLLRGCSAIPLWDAGAGRASRSGWPDLAWSGRGPPAVRFLGDLFVRASECWWCRSCWWTIASGITALGDPSGSAGSAGRTIGLFAVTPAIAVSVGMAVATWSAGARAAARHSGATALGTPPTPYEQNWSASVPPTSSSARQGRHARHHLRRDPARRRHVARGEAGRPFAAFLQSGHRPFCSRSSASSWRRRRSACSR